MTFRFVSFRWLAFRWLVLRWLAFRWLVPLAVGLPALLLVPGALAGPDFCDSFESCRANFQAAARNLVPQPGGVNLETLEVPSGLPRGNLPIDLLLIPATGHATNLVIIASGIHGAEAYAGSTLQTRFLGEMLAKVDRNQTTFLLIHMINPYGAITGRRVTENNVDLNRNFSSGGALYKNISPGYAAIQDFLNPKYPAQYGFFNLTKFYGNAAQHMSANSIKTLRTAILKGQYEFPKGIYYGGQSLEPAARLLTRHIVKAFKGKNYDRMLVVDLHTGYGEKGLMHVMPNPLVGSPLVIERTRLVMNATLGGYRLEDVVGDSDFYQTSGDFSSFIAETGMSTGMPSVPLLLEFGTLDSQKIFGSLQSLYRVIQENRLHWHGADNLDSKAQIEHDFREMFLPSDSIWRNQVLSQFDEHFPGFLARFQKADH